MPKCCQSVSRLAVLIEENYRKQDKHRPRFRSRYGLAASRQSLHGHSSNVRVFNKKCPSASKLANGHFIISIVRLTQSQRDYSMIVATRPDPTVRPPSRYQTGVLRYTNSDFLCDLCGKIRIFRCVRVVFRNFCYHGVITVFLVFLAYFFLHS